jgi:hypothetical protein
MAEYITKKKNMDAAQTPTGTRQEALKRRNKKDDYVVIIAPDRINKKGGGKVCKLATKGKGRAYGKNS